MLPPVFAFHLRPVRKSSSRIAAVRRVRPFNMERFGSNWVDFRKIVCWGKGKGHPRTCHEDPEGVEV
jgi:hypothetical protein